MSWLVIKLISPTNGSSLRFRYPVSYTHPDDRQVTLEEATQKSTQLNIMFMETSAKAGHNDKTLFKKIAMSLPGMEKEGTGGDAANPSTPHTISCLSVL